MTTHKYDPNENPNWNPDALVLVTFTGRETPAFNGFRPQYELMEEYLTSTHHWFIENGQALPNEPTEAFVKFLTPEAYPRCLSVGMEVRICEGSKKIGTAKILEVYNRQLQVNK